MIFANAGVLTIFFYYGLFFYGNSTTPVPDFRGADTVPVRLASRNWTRFRTISTLGFEVLRSIINRRFTELTSGWQAYTSGTATWNINQPQGVVTEVQLIAVADNEDESRHGFLHQASHIQGDRRLDRAEGSGFPEQGLL